MSEEVLIKFLKAGLIPVGGDDAKLLKLQQAASDLSAVLVKAPAKASAFALVAFDPEAPAKDPTVQEGLAALQDRWTTYANTFSGPPVTVVRAMLLDALRQAAAKDEHIGAAFVASARNVLPYTESGNERGIWIDTVGEIERAVDARAEAEWATPDSITVAAMGYEKPAAIKVGGAAATVDKAALTKKFEAAAGPSSQGPQGNVATNGNPHWAHNNPQHWVYEFGTRMAVAVAEAIETASKKTAVESIDFSQPLLGLAQSVSAHVDATLSAFSGATAGLQRRTNLLWWKEALYSPSARTSYRDLTPANAVALMALDLHRQVPVFSPASVASFLRETVLSLPELHQDDELTLVELVRDARKADALAPLREAAAELTAAPTGRGPVLGLIGHGGAVAAIDDSNLFRDWVGVRADTRLTLANWATWLFRELQATRATKLVPASKPRAKKS